MQQSCTRCGKSFEGDDQSAAVCPDCEAAAVSPAMVRPRSRWKGKDIVIGVLVVAVVGLLAFLYLRPAQRARDMVFGDLGRHAVPDSSGGGGDGNSGGGTRSPGGQGSGNAAGGAGSARPGGGSGPGGNAPGGTAGARSPGSPTGPDQLALDQGSPNSPPGTGQNPANMAASGGGPSSGQGNGPGAVPVDPGSGLPDSGPGGGLGGHPGSSASNPGSPAGNPGSPAGNPGSPAGHPGSPAGNPGSPAGNPGSPAGNPGSPAGNPGSPAGNPGSPAVNPGPSAGNPGNPAANPGGLLSAPSSGFGNSSRPLTINSGPITNVPPPADNSLPDPTNKDSTADLLAAANPGADPKMPARTADLLGTNTPSNLFDPDAGSNIIIMLDNSMNMMTNGKSFSARQEVVQTLQSMNASKSFYVMFFHSGGFDAMPFPGPVTATPGNIGAITNWLFSVGHRPGADPTKAMERALGITPTPDTVWFLSGSELSDDIADKIRAVNSSVNARINTIGFYTREGEPRMRKIADENQGTYRFVPPPGGSAQ